MVGRSVRFLGAAGVLLLGLAVCGARMVGYDGSRLPGDLIDCRFVGYVLEHGYQWLTGRVPSFWDAPFFFPLTGTLALSDNMVGALPLYAGLRVLLPGPEQAMVGLVVLFLLLNFAATVFFLRLMAVDWGAALVAAYPVAFGLFIIASSSHPQCLQLYPLVLTLAALGRFLTRPSPGGLAFLALALTLSGLTSFYYFAFSLLLAAVAVPLALAVGLLRAAAIRRALGWHPTVYAVVAGCLLVLAGNYWPYYRMSLETGPWPAMYQHLAPTLRMFVSPAEGSLAWGWLGAWLGPLPADRLFPGGLPLVGGVWGLWLLWRRPDPLRTAAGVLVAAGCLTCVLLLEAWGPGNPVRRLPGLAALRVVLRVGVVLVPCFALGLGLLLTRLTRGLAPGRRALVLGLILAAVVADQYVTPRGYPSFAWAQSVARVEALMARIPPQAKVFYVKPVGVPSDPAQLNAQVDAMLAAQRLGKATYDGYTGWVPPTLMEFFLKPTCRNLDVWRDQAAALCHPDQDPLALYAGTVLLDLPPCPPDPTVLSLPQGRHLRTLPRQDRQAEVRTEAQFQAATRTLTVTAAVRNLGRCPWYGLGDYSYHHAVFLVAELTDVGGARHNASLGRLPWSLAPGQTLRQRAEVVLPPGFVPAWIRVVPFQPPDGQFTVEPAPPVTVSRAP